MNEKILVVDDEKEIADLLEVYLKNDNYIVHKYYNGIEALECIQKTEIDLAKLIRKFIRTLQFRSRTQPDASG